MTDDNDESTGDLATEAAGLLRNAEIIMNVDCAKAIELIRRAASIARVISERLGNERTIQ